MSARKVTQAALLLLAASAIGGCESSSGGNYGDPGARPLPQGYSCQSVKTEMARLDSRGVRSAVEAKQSGQRLSPARSADADRYNQLLSYYLGARCHV